MYEIKISNSFRRDIRRCQRQNKDMQLLKEINELLITGTPLPLKNKDHLLMGNWCGHRECHLSPDWLLIYKLDEEEKVIEYIRTDPIPNCFANDVEGMRTISRKKNKNYKKGKPIFYQ